MVQIAHLTARGADLRAIAEDVSRMLSHAKVRGHAAYVTTAVSYPNGRAVVVRIDEDADGFFVSDDGYAYLEADMSGGSGAFMRVAPVVAERSGIQFDHRCFFAIHVGRDQLPGAVATVANASSRAVDRVLAAAVACRIISGKKRSIPLSTRIKCCRKLSVFSIPGAQWVAIRIQKVQRKLTNSLTG